MLFGELRRLCRHRLIGQHAGDELGRDARTRLVGFDERFRRPPIRSASPLRSCSICALSTSCGTPATSASEATPLPPLCTRRRVAGSTSASGEGFGIDLCPRATKIVELVHRRSRRMDAKTPRKGLQRAEISKDAARSPPTDRRRSNLHRGPATPAFDRRSARPTPAFAARRRDPARGSSGRGRRRPKRAEGGARASSILADRPRRLRSRASAPRPTPVVPADAGAESAASLAAARYSHCR